MTWNGLFFHSPTTSLLEIVITIHDYLIILLLSTLLLVLWNISFNFVRKKFNLEFFENHQIERIWTLAPFILLIFIIIPSLKSLYILDRCFFCGIRIRIIGHQWYWTYYFKELTDIMFDSYIVSPNETRLRLLEVDNRLLIPNFIPIRFIVSSRDVLHSWALPTFGVKIDAIPGRLNQFCLSTKRTGVFFGQCSEICGANHRFMPIVVESVSLKDFIKLI